MTMIGSGQKSLHGKVTTPGEPAIRSGNKAPYRPQTMKVHNKNVFIVEQKQVQGVCGNVFGNTVNVFPGDYIPMNMYYGDSTMKNPTNDSILINKAGLYMVEVYYNFSSPGLTKATVILEVNGNDAITFDGYGQDNIVVSGKGGVMLTNGNELKLKTDFVGATNVDILGVDNNYSGTFIITLT